jgi:hypothetical protein
MSNVPARVQDVHHRWLRLATTINIKNTGATGFDVSYACIQVFGGPVKPGDSTEQIVIWTASHYRTKPLAQKCEKLNDALTPDEHISRLFLIYLPKTYADKTLVVRTVTLTSAGAAKLWSCEEGQPLEIAY